MSDSGEAGDSHARGSLGERLWPALLLAYGSVVFGAALGGVAESSAAAKVFWMALPVLPGAVAGLAGLWIGSFISFVEWAPAVILAAAMTLALLWLVDRARTWERAKGIPVLIAIALLCGAQALWLMLMMRAEERVDGDRVSLRYCRSSPHVTEAAPWGTTSPCESKRPLPPASSPSSPPVPVTQSTAAMTSIMGMKTPSGRRSPTTFSSPLPARPKMTSPA